MFSITYKVNGYPRIEETNDTKDLADIVIGLVDEPFTKIKVETIAAWMNWGDVFKSKDYTIECRKESRIRV